MANRGGDEILALQRVPIVTFTTDFGFSDGYVGAMKGVVLSLAPDARLVDITHGIAAQDVAGGAIALAQAASLFPRGTIHVAVVDPGVGGARADVVVASGGSVFIGPDNGVLSLAAAAEPRQVYRIDAAAFRREPVSPTFHGRDVFAPTAGRLAAGAAPADVGPPMASLVELDPPLVRRVGDRVEGRVTYVDRFGNLLTSLAADLVWPDAHIEVIGARGDVPSRVRQDLRRRGAGSAGRVHRQLGLAGDRAARRLGGGVDRSRSWQHGSLAEGIMRQRVRDGVVASGRGLLLAAACGLLAVAAGGCTVGDGNGSVTGPIFFLGCAPNGAPYGEKDNLKLFDLAPRFFAGEPIEENAGVAVSQPTNILTIRVQRNGNRIEVNDVLYFNVRNSYEVARCVRGRTHNGVPDWDQRMTTSTFTEQPTKTPWCDWSGVIPTIDGGTFDAGDTGDAGTAAGQAVIHLGTEEIVNASLALGFTCHQATVSATAFDGWLIFDDFSDAAQPNVPPEMRDQVAKDFKVNFGDRLRARFEMVLGDQRIVGAIKMIMPIPEPLVGGSLAATSISISSAAARRSRSRDGGDRRDRFAGAGRRRGRPPAKRRSGRRGHR